MTKMKAKRNANRDDMTPPQPLPNPKAKKKTREDTADESLEDAAHSEDDVTAEDSIQVTNLASQFEVEAAVAGTLQLWTQLILYPTTIHWRTIKIEDELTGFLSDKLFGGGKTIHNLSRLGIISQRLDP
jgi:hypothetical protein